MTMLDTRPAQPEPAQPEAAAPAGKASSLDLEGRLAPGWGRRLTVAWVAVFIVGVALEPAPAEGESLGLVAGGLSVALAVCWAVMALGFARGRRLGAAGSLAGAVTLVAFTIGCPLSGHHAGIGAWWFLQLAGAMALVGLSGRALRAAA